MQHHDLIGAFDHHFASHLTGKIKPDEEAFQHVLAALGCEVPRRCFWMTASLTLQQLRESA
jgi:FMN phosphatase YigB (HAD superfamily)